SCKLVFSTKSIGVGEATIHELVTYLATFLKRSVILLSSFYQVISEYYNNIEHSFAEKLIQKIKAENLKIAKNQLHLFTYTIKKQKIDVIINSMLVSGLPHFLIIIDKNKVDSVFSHLAIEQAAT